MLTNHIDNYLQNYFNNFDNQFCIMSSFNDEHFAYSKFIKENEDKRNRTRANEFVHNLIKKVETDVKNKNEGNSLLY